MAETRHKPTVQELGAELEEIEQRLGDAALAGLKEERFVRLLMRQRALPEILEARRKPIRYEIARLQREQRQADEQVRQARENPPDEVPESLRNRVSLQTYRQQVIGNASRRQSETGRELKEAKKRLRELEETG